MRVLGVVNSMANMHLLSQGWREGDRKILALT